MLGGRKVRAGDWHSKKCNAILFFVALSVVCSVVDNLNETPCRKNTVKRNCIQIGAVRGVFIH